MTLPTRPAPAPPGSRAQVAAATANASLEQLRLQLAQQQELQRQNSFGSKLIKLPPPPKVPQPVNGINGGFGANAAAANGSITRKFPQARYAPATNWDDSPFDLLGGATTTTSGKKPPPPRPPPPKIQPKKNPAPTPPPLVQQSSSSSNILSNIFHRKKSSRAPTPNSQARIYGTATYGSSTTSSNTSGTNAFNSNTNSWNNAWNTQQTSSSTTTTTQHTTTTNGEPQLISFDSPPSSPTFTQKSNSDCLSVDSFSSDSNFSSPNNGSVSQPESGFEDDFSAATGRSRPATTSPLDPWETIDAFGPPDPAAVHQAPRYGTIGTAPVRNLNVVNSRVQNTPDNPLCNGKSLVPPAPTLNMPTIIKPKISQKPKAPKPPTLAKPSGLNSLYSDLPTPPSPPMPQCAPPPPPPQIGMVSSSSAYTSSKPAVSLLDVISGKVDALALDSGSHVSDYGGGVGVDEQPYGIALYDFQSTEEGDLCFRENEKIYLLEQVSESWYKGRTRSGCEGIFPINYVEIKVPLSAKQTAAQSQLSTAASSNYSTATTTPTYDTTTTYPPTTNSTSKIRCLYNFPAEVEGDLAIKENEMVTILYRINEDWLYGEVNGRQGQFPANFLEYVPSNIPMP
ncbi:SH3 domain-containing lethal (3) 05822 [Musca autumnalis]|uniref:SH3 domain-containing lethal (3) 05822 n=1 Tax=Musca autumnalis TaxID=221902 RepID=UPI003CF30EF1